MNFFDNLFRNIFGPPQGPNKINSPEDKPPDELLDSLFRNDDTSKSGDDLRLAQRYSVFTDIATVHKFFEDKMRTMMEQLLEQQQMLDDIIISGTDTSELTEQLWPKEDDLSQIPKPSRSRNPRGEVLKPGYETVDEAGGKIDRDLDEYVAKYGFKSLLTGVPGYVEPKLDVEIPNRIISKGTTRSHKVVRRPDGSVESEEVTRDSNGNELRKITHTIGDKSRTVEIRTGPDGTTTTETFENCDEKDFVKMWNSGAFQKPGFKQPKLLPENFSWDDFFK